MLEKIYHEEVMTLLEMLSEQHVSMLLHGTIGIGKTYTMMRASQVRAKRLGKEWSVDYKNINKDNVHMFIPIILYLHEPTEFIGLPFPNEDRTGITYLKPDMLPVKGSGDFFFDEIDKAPDLMKNAAYQIIEDRRLGNWRMPDGYVAHAACNLATDRSFSFTMPDALNNRFLHWELAIPPVHDIEKDGHKIQGWINGFGIPNAIDHRILNYLATQPSDIHTYDPSGRVKDPNFATPRTWEKLSRIVKEIEDNNILHMLISGGCGTAIANKFIAFLKLQKNFNIEKIFKGTFNKKDVPKEIDELYALISGLIGYYKHNPTDKNAVRLLEIARMLNKEHTVLILKQANSVDGEFFDKLEKTIPETYDELADELFALLI